MGHSTHHGSLGALDDTLVLGRLGDAGPGCKTRSSQYSEQGCGGRDGSVSRDVGLAWPGMTRDVGLA